MKPPSASIVVDSNIILSAILGTTTYQKVIKVGEVRSLLITQRSVEEIKGVLASKSFADQFGADATNVVSRCQIIPEIHYGDVMMKAAKILRFAAADKIGSITDAHVLACAWMYEADIWSHDRDFAGTGWPSWSSANLHDHAMDEGQ
jgi:predicted nucleic acid-binding protein